MDSLVEDAQRPDPQQLRVDREAVIGSDPSVKRLIIWRNNVYAHLSPEHALDAKKLSEEFPLLFEDIEALLKNALEVVNRYSVLFIRTSHAARISGHDDYLTLLKAVEPR